MTDDLAGRTIYVPYMSDHVYVIAAAMRALGLTARFCQNLMPKRCRSASTCAVGASASRAFSRLATCSSRRDVPDSTRVALPS